MIGSTANFSSCAATAPRLPRRQTVQDVMLNLLSFTKFESLSRCHSNFCQAVTYFEYMRLRLLRFCRGSTYQVAKGNCALLFARVEILNDFFISFSFYMFHSTNQSDIVLTATMEELYSAEGIPVSSTETQG